MSMSHFRSLFDLEAVLLSWSPNQLRQCYDVSVSERTSGPKRPYSSCFGSRMYITVAVWSI